MTNIKDLYNHINKRETPMVTKSVLIEMYVNYTTDDDLDEASINELVMP